MYLSGFLLIVLLGIEVLRYILFAICYLFGYRVWLFPDYNRDDKGILGVFEPVLTVEV